MSPAAATTSHWDRTTATVNTETASQLLGLSSGTVSRYAKTGQLEAIWTGTWRYTVTGLAREIARRQGGVLRVPVHTAAFGDTLADDMDAFAVRLSLFAPADRDRVMTDTKGLPFPGTYTPGEAEQAHHLARLTDQTIKAGLI
jgi:hypothetical protein